MIKATDGRVVWDAGRLRLPRRRVPGDRQPEPLAPGSAGQIHGLFEVTDGIYQVRGVDLSNMTIVEGDEGVLVIDPLISTECAAAALALYREHRGDRPVTGVLYTHSHVDHFGGVRGVVSEEDVVSGQVPVLAPEGFLEHAVSENVYAGIAMARRATYMYGALLPKGPAGQVGTGLGQTTSTGTITLIAPTVTIEETGQEETVDGIRMVFQMTPGTEAPAEMNFLLPDRRALCMAENATHNLHNVLTLRGAQIRDARLWSAYLDEAIDLFAAEADVAFAQHHWPTWGGEEIAAFLSTQRDLYGFIHDQTLRLLNQGLVAERDRRGARAAAGARARVALPRLLRVAEPQRQGRLPALPRVVRRQPGAPVAASARGGRPALRRARRRSRCPARQRAGGLRGGRLPLGRRGRRAPRLRGPR